MKLNKDFITHNTEDKSLLVPVGGAGFSGLVEGNRTLGAILEQLKHDTAEEDIVAAMLRQFDAPEDIITRDVRRVISELSKIGAIDE